MIKKTNVRLLKSDRSTSRNFCAMMFIAKLFAKREKIETAQTSFNGEFMTSLILPLVPLQSIPIQQPEWVVKIHIRAGGSPAPMSSYFSKDKSQAPHRGPTSWGPSWPLHHFKNTHSLPPVKSQWAWSSLTAFALALPSAWNIIAQVLPLPSPFSFCWWQYECHLLRELEHCI